MADGIFLDSDHRIGGGGAIDRRTDIFTHSTRSAHAHPSVNARNTLSVPVFTQSAPTSPAQPVGLETADSHSTSGNQRRPNAFSTPQMNHLSDLYEPHHHHPQPPHHQTEIAIKSGATTKPKGSGTTSGPGSSSGGSAWVGCKRIGSGVLIAILLVESVIVLLALQTRAVGSSGTGAGSGFAASSLAFFVGGGGGEDATANAVVCRNKLPSDPTAPPLPPPSSEPVAVSTPGLAAAALSLSIAPIQSSPAAPLPAPEVSTRVESPPAPAASPPAPAASTAATIAGESAAPVASNPSPPVNVRAPGPVMVTGSHRSGTTWLGNTIVQSSPRMCFVDEPFHMTHKSPATPWPLWYFYLPEWLERAPAGSAATDFVDAAGTPTGTLDALISGITKRKFPPVVAARRSMPLPKPTPTAARPTAASPLVMHIPAIPAAGAVGPPPRNSHVPPVAGEPTHIVSAEQLFAQRLSPAAAPASGPTRRRLLSTSSKDALSTHPLMSMKEAFGYMEVSMKCQLKVAPRQYPQYLRLVKSRIRKPKADLPVLKDPMALFSTPFLVKHFSVRPIVLIRHPAAFIDSLVRPHWGFDWNDLLGQPMLIADLLAEFQTELLAARDNKSFANQYTYPYPSPQRGQPTGLTAPPDEAPITDPPAGWLKFSGVDLTPEDPKGPKIPVPFLNQPIASIAHALNTDPKYAKMNAFTSAGRTRADPGPRGGWVRVKPQSVVGPNNTTRLVDTSALYVRESAHQDLIEYGILLWRIFYTTVLRFRLEHPDWLYIRYEDMVHHNRLGTFQEIMSYAGIEWTPAIKQQLLTATKWPRGIDYFRYTFSSAEIAHINARTSDVWRSFYSDSEWYGNLSYWDAGELSPPEVAARDAAEAKAAHIRRLSSQNAAQTPHPPPPPPQPSTAAARVPV